MNPHAKVKPSPGKLLLGNVLVIGILLFMTECGYRQVLNKKLAASPLPYYFFATSQSLLEYDPEMGYNYKASATAHSAVIKQGRVVRLYTNRVNSLGATSAEGIYDPEAALQILTLGDSFTGLTYSDRPWPDAMHDALETDARPVSVFNAGRDGYGVLQMIHAARVQAAKHQPDHLVIALITDDLTRDRFWRYDLNQEQPPRVITSIESDPDKVKAPYVDTYLVDERVTPAWTEQLLTREDQSGDPVLEDILERAREGRLASMTLPFMGGGYSVLWNRITRKDPYFTLNGRGRNPRTSLVEYSRDPVFVEDIKLLKAGGIPVSVFHLPDRSEIQAGAYRLDPQKKALLQNLEAQLGQPVVSLLGKVRIPVETVDDYFLLPHDHHPNANGMTAYGEAIAAWLEANRLVQN